jgi:hypothetical protein
MTIRTQDAKGIPAIAQIIIHRDHTCTYWSVYTQSWHTHVPFEAIPDEDIASMAVAERERLLTAITRS